MYLARCSDQKSETLDQFYSQLRDGDSYVEREIGKTMLSLLSRITAADNTRRVWGLTSHYRLCLLARDSYNTPWLVIISVLDERNYTIEYLMPERLAPWPGGAYVRGEARSEDDALRMVLVAMEKSEGWKLDGDT